MNAFVHSVVPVIATGIISMVWGLVILALVLGVLGRLVMFGYKMSKKFAPARVAARQTYPAQVTEYQVREIPGAPAPELTQDQDFIILNPPADYVDVEWEYV